MAPTSDHEVSKTFHIRSQNVNDSPEIKVLQDINVKEDSGPTEITIEFDDPDNLNEDEGAPYEKHIVTVESDQRVTAVDHISGDQAKSGARYTLTPANHFFGTAQIKITVKDNSGDATSDTTISNFRFIVASVEDAPILAAVPEEARINNETCRTFQMQANDNDLGDQLDL